MKYDLLIIGSGPGGYVAAIRASQLGLKTAVVEKENLGGICLNWGCIPTKSLLKSAQVLNYTKHISDYGIIMETEAKAHLSPIVKRSRGISEMMNKGVAFLLKKNNVDVIFGTASLKKGKKIEVRDKEGNTSELEANNIIIATGARSKELPFLKQDGKKIIGYREALVLKQKPETILIVGSGAIGCEFAYFFNSIGSKVFLVEALPNIAPLEDEDVSKQLGRSFKRSKIKVMTSSTVQSVDVSRENCKVSLKTKKGVENIEVDVVLSAVGISPNIENIGLESVGIAIENGKIKVDDFYQTNIDGYYAIGDVIETPALAHVASHEGIICVEKIAGQNPEVFDYSNVPSCVYTVPEIASVGITEKKAVEQGAEIKIGKFPFSASGKAKAAGIFEGFVKLIFDAKTDKVLGAHIIGENVTEMISEIVLGKKLGATAKDILKAIHPHPTMSEAVMEAAAAAHGEVIHL